MPVLTAVCPAIGALATGVALDVHGQKKGLNLIAYIAGDFATGKGSIDPVIEAWMSEVMAIDKMYQNQEEEWRAKKRAAKNKKEQPEEPKLPVRCLPLNNTVANLAERLDPQFTEGQAMQHSVAVKGAGVTRNSVQQMLKNWRKQGLIELIENKRYRKLR